MKPAEGSNNWVVVFRTSEVHQAMIAKALLHQEDIDAVVLNKQDSMYPNFNESVPVQLLVKGEDVMKANRIIEKSNL